jgi:hypothetical protein
MVLEALLSSVEARKHPVFVIIAAFIVNSIGLWTAYFIFPNNASIVSIAFLTIVFTRFLHKAMLNAEDQEAHHHHTGLSALLFVRHVHVVKAYSLLFLGLIVSYSVWYAAMPMDVREKVFFEQDKTLTSIAVLKDNVTGAFAANEGPCRTNTFCWFELIFLNNGIVLLLSILFSFVFGAGAIFLIAWQASVIGALIGKTILALVAQAVEQTGLSVASAYAVGITTGLIGLAPHGIPEALGYLIGAVAGGIISVALTKRNTNLGEIELIAKDAVILIVIALLLLLFGSYIEASAIVSAIG